MGSSGKTRTTWAKLAREGKLREKRVEKEARKASRKAFAADEAAQAGLPTEQSDEDAPELASTPDDVEE